MKNRLRFFAPLFALALFAGCDDDATVTAQGQSQETVQGTITSIRDMVPLDGGVTLEVDVSAGGEDTLFMPSMFTSPPPDPRLTAIYRTILTLDVGSEVRATGVRYPEGLRISRLVVLEP